MQYTIHALQKFGFRDSTINKCFWGSTAVCNYELVDGHFTCNKKWQTRGNDYQLFAQTKSCLGQTASRSNQLNTTAAAGKYPNCLSCDAQYKYALLSPRTIDVKWDSLVFVFRKLHHLLSLYSFHNIHEIRQPYHIVSCRMADPAIITHTFRARVISAQNDFN